MSYAFVTCVSLGFGCLERIYKIGYKIDLLITLEDKLAKRKSGRVYLDSFASKNKIELIKCKNINESKIITKIIKSKINFLFVIGWSQILKNEIISIPNLKIIGMHPTLLPKGRGRASIPWAILKNLKVTGVTAFKIDKDVDSGPIVLSHKVKISKNENATTLYRKISSAHQLLTKKIFILIKSNKLVFKKQNDRYATYWKQRTPSDGKILHQMKLIQVRKMHRALMHPYPGIFIILKNKKLLIKKLRYSNLFLEERLKILNNKIYFKLKDGYLIISKWKEI